MLRCLAAVFSTVTGELELARTPGLRGGLRWGVAAVDGKSGQETRHHKPGYPHIAAEGKHAWAISRSVTRTSADIAPRGRVIPEPGGRVGVGVRPGGTDAFRQSGRPCLVRDGLSDRSPAGA